MKQKYILKGLDCPHCSAQIESEIANLDGVSGSCINLMTQTLTVETVSDIPEQLYRKIETIVHAHEPDVEVLSDSKRESAALKQVFFLKGLDCPNCSAKIESEVGSLPGVHSSVVNLMNQTLTIEVAPSVASSITSSITEIVHTHEPDVEVSLQQNTKRSETDKGHSADKIRLTRMIAGAILFAGAVGAGKLLSLPMTIELPILVFSYVILGYDVIFSALKNISKGRIFDEHFLMSISTIGAFIIREYPEAVAVMLFYQVGEFFQDLAVQRSRKNIADLMDIRPDSATVKRHGSWVITAPDVVSVGDIILVKPGEKIPLDGVVEKGDSMLDTRALTGESLPRSVHSGDLALSGCINQNGTLEIRVQKSFGESTASKIIDMVENAAAKKAPTENFITKFAGFYTPIVVIAAILVAVIPPLFLGGVWEEWIRRCFVFLVISCPCALVISIPLTFFGGIGAASRSGVLIKGSNYLEVLAQLKTVVFDKTGTLTKGTFSVSDIQAADGTSKDELLELAAHAEYYSNHPIAASIRSAYAKDIEEDRLSEYHEISGFGISVQYCGNTLLAGNAKLMEQNNITFLPSPAIGTKVYLAKDQTYLGCITISDIIKSDSRQAVLELKQNGIQKTVMLTGDDSFIAENLASEIGIEECYSELLPNNKVAKVEELLTEDGKLAFVGDGINDAPVLARADVGIAMGALGSDAAIEAADIVLMTDEPGKLIDAIKIAKKTKRILVENIIFILVVKILLLILGTVGLANMWEAVFGDVGVMVLAVLNAMRILKK